MRDYLATHLTEITLALALLGLVLNAAVFLVLCRRIDDLPRPFWMGEWPPVAGIIDDAYDYSHLNFDWLQPGQRVPYGRGLVLEALPKRASFTDQAAQQLAGTESGQPTVSTGEDAPLAAQHVIKRITTVGTPDSEAFARLEALGNGRFLVSISIDRRQDQFAWSAPGEESRAGQADTGNSDLNQPKVGDTHTEQSIRVGLKPADMRRVDGTDNAVGPLVTPGFPHGHHFDSHAVTPQRPRHVDDTQHSAQQRHAERDSSHPVPLHSITP